MDQSGGISYQGFILVRAQIAKTFYLQLHEEKP
jgi:hypothetical protein